MPNKIKILINASTVKYSGGLIVSLDIIRSLIQDENQLLLVCPGISDYKKLEKQIEIKYVPDILLHYIFRPILDSIWIKKTIKKFNPEKIISLGNLPVKTNIQQIHFHDNAFISGNYNKTFRLNIKSRSVHQLRKVIFKYRLKYINKIIVQTELEKKRLSEISGSHPNIVVLSPLIPFHLKNTTSDYYIPGSTDYKRILCLSHYHTHKNLEILYEAAKLCQQHNLFYQFLLTINNENNRSAKRLLKRIEADSCGNRIINLGEISVYNVSAVVQKVSALILPSLVETYGLNCIEAWFHSKPLFISDMKYSREVCDEAAVFFDPVQADDLVIKINQTFNHPETIPGLIKNGKKALTCLTEKKDLLAEVNKEFV